jgi:hypothetical protein
METTKNSSVFIDLFLLSIAGPVTYIYAGGYVSMVLPYPFFARH